MRAGQKHACAEDIHVCVHSVNTLSRIVHYSMYASGIYTYLYIMCKHRTIYGVSVSTIIYFGV